VLRDGVLRGRSRILPHARGHVLTVATACALPQPRRCSVHAVTVPPNAPHGGSHPVWPVYSRGRAVASCSATS
jgi:hypothetical protein